MNRLLSLTFASVLASTFMASAADDLFEDKVLVTGPKFEITENQLSRAYLQRKAQMAAMGRSIPEQLRNDVEKETLDLLILKYTLLNMATEADRIAAAELVNQQIGNAPPAMLGQQATLLGLTEAEFRQELVDQNTASQVVNREFKPKVVVTEEMSKKFYDENQAQFEAPERVKATHILLATKLPDGTELSEDDKKAKRAEADALLVRAKAGEDFLALAKEYSEDPGVAQNGGEYTFGKGQMVPEFEAAAWTMEDGQISGIVVTAFGYHIIKKNETLPAQIQEFSEADPSIREYLNRQELQKVLHDYTGELKKDPSIVFVDEKYKP